MSQKKQLFNEEEMDFVKEMMNIGAGNAVTALHQLLGSPVDLVIPKVHVLPTLKVTSLLHNPATIMVCVRTEMLGDITGVMFFTVPQQFTIKLVSQAENLLPKVSNSVRMKLTNDDYSVIVEIGNILCGVYLTAIHDFCGLNVYHTVPGLAVDMFQSLIDESFVVLSSQMKLAIMVENEFIIKNEKIKTNLLIIPFKDSVKQLVEAFKRTEKIDVTR
jgi:chemotaxis protein CheC